MSIEYREVEGTASAESISFGHGLFEILALSLQSKSASHIGHGRVSWYTTEPDRTHKSVFLLSGWFRSSYPLVMGGTKIVQGPAQLYVTYDLPSGAYVMMRVGYRRLK